MRATPEPAIVPRRGRSADDQYGRWGREVVVVDGVTTIQGARERRVQGEGLKPEVIRKVWNRAEWSHDPEPMSKLGKSAPFNTRVFDGQRSQNKMKTVDSRMR